MKRWLVLSCAAIASLSVRAQANPIPSDVVINEVVYDSEGTDNDTWLELKGPAGMPLDGYEVVGCNGNGGTEYQSILLDGYSIPDDGYFVIAENPAMPEADMVDSNVDYQNGPDSIILKYNGTPADAVGYGVFGGGDVFCGEGSPAPDQTPPNSLARCPDGYDSGDNSVDFKLDDTPTPGAENDAYCPQGQGACCLPDGACVVTSADDCAAQGGDYQGESTACDPYPCPPMQVTICDVAEDDINGAPVLEGRLVEFEGIAISESGTWSPTTQEFSLTDGDCCIDIFGGAIDPFISIGDQVHVIGTVQNYNGKTEVSSPGLVVTIVSSGHPIPTPAVITTFELSVNGEQYESCLFQIDCVNIVGGDPWPADGVNANVTIDDGSGPVTMRIDKDTNVDGSPVPEGPFTVIGIGDQYDTSPPWSDGYQIKPRSLDDLVFNCGPETGACCFPDGSCQMVTMEECADLLGIFDGGPCEPNPCEVLLGACCFPDGTCELTVSADCAGEFQGAGTVCEPNPCVPQTGACCFPTGECVVTSPDECAAQEGEYQGTGTVCEPNPCEQPSPTEETSWGKIKHQYR